MRVITGDGPLTFEDAGLLEQLGEYKNLPIPGITWVKYYGSLKITTRQWRLNNKAITLDPNAVTGDNAREMMKRIRAQQVK